MSTTTPTKPYKPEYEFMTPDEYDRAVTRALIGWRYPDRNVLGVRIVQRVSTFRDGARMVCHILYEDGSDRYISCPYPAA